MEEEKTKLREALFQFYFEEGEDRIPIKTLLEKLQSVGEICNRLHKILEKNIKNYDKTDSLDKVKIINYNNGKYLIIKTFMLHYVVIDLEAKKSLEKDTVTKIFNEAFFENNFDEGKYPFNMYFFSICNNIDEVTAFFLINQNILEMPNKIYCQFDIGEAFTYISIDLWNKSGQLSFQTPDKTLYDLLLFDLNLNPSRMQDCVQKIGLERTQEMFTKLKDIQLPKSNIPTCFLIEEEKIKLRAALFQFYFEDGEDRMPITTLLKQLNPIVEVWQNLRTILETNVDMYDRFCGLKLVKIIPYQGNSYLFIKEYMWQYLIIDLNTKQVLLKENVSLLFSKEFFIQNLEEDETDLNEDWLDWCYQCQNADIIVKYCQAYEDILKLPNTIACEYRIGEALTYLRIGLANKKVQLGFKTPNQFLYEQLYLHLDLTPSVMQDAHHSMGKEKMKEIFSKVKDIKIPISCIPEEFLEEGSVRTRSIQK